MSITQVIPDNDFLSVLMPASVAIARGDLLCMVSNVAQKASSRADGGSLALNQADFAPIFLGVMRDVRLVGETGSTDYRVVVTDGIFDCPCASATFEIGDLVGIDRDSGNSVNYNQQVIKVTDPDLAIGIVVKRGTSITTVRCRLTSRFAWSYAFNLAKAGRNGSIIAVDGAITQRSGVVVVTKVGVCAMTIADPIATTDDYKRLTVISATANAHTLSNAAGSGFNAGGSGTDVGTFGGAKGDGITIIAYQGKWYVESKTNVTLA